ncbi:MAG: hypothetical protein Hyperionvirus18_48 [Hyperionvirus sp.]|uniref:Uncharacterized protein n=1 Tax=Hyperionvirus sp. TaxID=2487770 RepID=A0A3G5AAM9_9VIRU|nr:MAG: hypothetical protein Hyperionvirus18_48 [Hyperionvirus sp.]
MASKRTSVKCNGTKHKIGGLQVTCKEIFLDGKGYCKLHAYLCRHKIEEKKSVPVKPKAIARTPATRPVETKKQPTRIVRSMMASRSAAAVPKQRSAAKKSASPQMNRSRPTSAIVTKLIQPVPEVSLSPITDDDMEMVEKKVKLTEFVPTEPPVIVRIDNLSIADSSQAVLTLATLIEESHIDNLPIADPAQDTTVTPAVIYKLPIADPPHDIPAVPVLIEEPHTDNSPIVDPPQDSQTQYTNLYPGGIPFKEIPFEWEINPTHIYKKLDFKRIEEKYEHNTKNMLYSALYDNYTRGLLQLYKCERDVLAYLNLEKI